MNPLRVHSYLTLASLMSQKDHRNLSSFFLYKSIKGMILNRPNVDCEIQYLINTATYKNWFCDSWESISDNLIIGIQLIWSLYALYSLINLCFLWLDESVHEVCSRPFHFMSKSFLMTFSWEWLCWIRYFVWKERYKCWRGRKIGRYPWYSNVGKSFYCIKKY